MRLSLLLAVLLLPTLAHAQTKVDSYGYKFDDEYLLGDTFGSPAAIIKGGPRPHRVMLIRPRTEFVGALLKTVEAL